MVAGGRGEREGYTYLGCRAKSVWRWSLSSISSTSQGIMTPKGICSSGEAESWTN